MKILKRGLIRIHAIDYIVFWQLLMEIKLQGIKEHTNTLPIDKTSVCAREDVWPGFDTDLLCKNGFDITAMFCTQYPEFDTSLSIVNHVSGALADVHIRKIVISTESESVPW